MKITDSGDFIVILNMLLYVALSGVCLYKYKWRNLGTFLSLLYAVSSVAAWLLYNSPLYHATYRNTSEPTIDGCLCLFIINAALILTFTHFDLSKYICVHHYNPDALRLIQKIVVLLLSVYLLFHLPAAALDYFTSANLARMRNAVYGTHIEQRFFVLSLIPRVIGSMPIVLIAITGIRYFLFRQMDKWDWFSILIYFLMNFYLVFSSVSRGTVVFVILELAVVLIVFYPFLSKRIKKKILVCSAALLPFLLSIFVTISVARFGSYDKKPEFVGFTTLRYVGEAQLDFMTWLYPDLKEPFHGYRQLTLFRRIVGLDYDDGLGRKGTSVYDPYIKKTYKYTHPTYMFYGLAGDLVMNWGRIAGMILAVSICLLLRKLYKDGKAGISSFFIILAVVLGSYYAKGIFYADYKYESGNLLMLFLLLLYFYLKDTGRTYLIRGVSR